MKKVLCLVIILLLALGSTFGYTMLNGLIAAGSLRIAAGELQIKQGEQMLAKGKERLASGERRLSRGKQAYSGMKNASLLGIAGVVTAPLALVAAASTQATGDKIAAGQKQVEAGKNKIANGEEQLATGKEQLRAGIERLNQATWVRFFCGIGSIIFTAIFVVLLFYWRRSLMMVFRKSK